MDKLKRYGFKVDQDLSNFKNVFSNKKINEIHIDTYLNDPYIFFARIIEQNVLPSLSDDRFILKKKDGTVLINIPFINIERCMVKEYADTHHQIIFFVNNVCYKILTIT